MNQYERCYILQERRYLYSLISEYFRQLQQKTKYERATKIKILIYKINPVFVKYYLISIQKGSSMYLDVLNLEEYRTVLDTKIQTYVTILKLQGISI